MVCDEKVLPPFVPKSPGDAVYFCCLCLLLGQHCLAYITSAHQTSDILDHFWPVQGTSNFLVVPESPSVPQNLDSVAILSELSIPCDQSISIFPASSHSLSFPWLFAHPVDIW